MKIERISDNQIRCILTRDDLDARQIKLSEFAYGSEKAKLLFREMMSFAYDQYGFEIDNFPIMIEAVPLSSDAIVLIVTKIAYPDELDSRFANFSDTGEDEGLYLKDYTHSYQSTAKDIIEQTKDSSDDDIYRQYAFNSLDEVIHLSHLINESYFGKNSLYKGEDGKYYLLLYMDSHTPQEFNKICNTITEYAQPVVGRAQSIYHLFEHGKLICKDNALMDLSDL